MVPGHNIRTFAPPAAQMFECYVPAPTQSGVGGARSLLGIEQLDVPDAGGAARHALDGLDEPQQQVVARARSADGISLGDHEVKHGDALEAVTHVKDDAHGAGQLALALDREE